MPLFMSGIIYLCSIQFTFIEIYTCSCFLTGEKTSNSHITTMETQFSYCFPRFYLSFSCLNPQLQNLFKISYVLRTQKTMCQPNSCSFQEMLNMLIQSDFKNHFFFTFLNMGGLKGLLDFKNSIFQKQNLDTIIFEDSFIKFANYF